MEVDKVSFYPLLLDLLTDISEAHFVSFDLELSGVPTKKVKNGSGRPSLQERYVETKERLSVIKFFRLDSLVWSKTRRMASIS